MRPTWSQAGVPLGPGSPGPWAPRSPRGTRLPRGAPLLGPREPRLASPCTRAGRRDPRRCSPAPSGVGAAAGGGNFCLPASGRCMSTFPAGPAVQDLEVSGLLFSSSSPVLPGTPGHPTPWPGLAPPLPKPGRRMQAAGWGPDCPLPRPVLSSHSPQAVSAEPLEDTGGPLRAAVSAGGPASLFLLLRLPALLVVRAEPDLTQLPPVQETRKIPPPPVPPQPPSWPPDVLRDPQPPRWGRPPRALTHAAAAAGARTAGLWAAVCSVPARLAAGPPPRRHCTAAPAAAASPPGPTCAPPSAICSSPPPWPGEEPRE